MGEDVTYLEAAASWAGATAELAQLEKAKKVFDREVRLATQIRDKAERSLRNSVEDRDNPDARALVIPDGRVVVVTRCMIEGNEWAPTIMVTALEGQPA